MTYTFPPKTEIHHIRARGDFLRLRREDLADGSPYGFILGDGSTLVLQLDPDKAKTIVALQTSRLIDHDAFANHVRAVDWARLLIRRHLIPVPDPKAVKFDIDPAGNEAVWKILNRWEGILKKDSPEQFKRYRRMDAEMDLLATNANGCPLDFEKLLRADDFNLAHDLVGIGVHLDRTTGKLSNHFLPRCAK